jgi:hypothetical protein
VLEEVEDNTEEDNETREAEHAEKVEAHGVEQDEAQLLRRTRKRMQEAEGG